MMLPPRPVASTLLWPPRRRAPGRCPGRAVVGRGSRGAGAFAAGLILGDLVWARCGHPRLAVVAQTFHEVFLVINTRAPAISFISLTVCGRRQPPRDVAGDGRRRRLRRPVLRRPRRHLGNPKVVAFYPRAVTTSSTFRA